VLRLKRIALISVAFVLLSAADAAGASASVFTVSSTGTFTGTQVTPSVFTFNSVTVECGTTDSEGETVATETNELPFFVRFATCKAFGSIAAQVSRATVSLTANQTLDLLEGFTITIPALGCHLTVPAQGPLSSVSLVNWPETESNLSGITFTSSGGICGASGTSGTLTGTNEIPGPIAWDS
jgi:hypothetical protein